RSGRFVWRLHALQGCGQTVAYQILPGFERLIEQITGTHLSKSFKQIESIVVCCLTKGRIIENAFQYTALLILRYGVCQDTKDIGVLIKIRFVRAFGQESA